MSSVDNSIPEMYLILIWLLPIIGRSVGWLIDSTMIDRYNLRHTLKIVSCSTMINKAMQEVEMWGISYYSVFERQTVSSRFILDCTV